MTQPQKKLKLWLLPGALLLLIALGWYMVIQQWQTMIQTSVSTYQQTQLEIVRSIARSIKNYVQLQVGVLGRNDLTAIEQEIFTLFVQPVHLLDHGDAWIYAPEHIIFDLSADLPPEYRGKNMAEIFALQAQHGASHHEAMVQAVMKGQEGVGWYIWLPQKGREIAAWTPVMVDNYTWVIGLSTPLSEILETNGDTNQLRASITIMALGTLAALAFLFIWLQTNKALEDSHRLYQSLVNTLPRRIYRKDRQNRFIFGNQAFLDELGQPLTGIVGKTDFDFYPPEIAARHRQEDTQLLLSGKMQDTIEEHPLPDGQKRYLQITKTPVFNSRREIIGLQAISWDITQQKHAELERERLLEAEREQRLLAQTLGEVFLALTSQTSHEAVLDEILRQIRRLVSCSAANIMLLQDGLLKIVRWHGYETHIAHLQQPLADFPIDAHVIQTRQGLVIPDVQQDPHWIKTPVSPWIKSFLAVPLCLQDQVLGLLRLDSNLPYNFSSQDLSRLQPLANAAAIALENARLYEQAQQEITVRKQTELELLHRNAELLTLLYAGATISTSLDLQVVLETITREMASLLNAQRCLILQWAETDHTLSLIAAFGLDQPQEPAAPYNLADIPLAPQVLSERYAQQILLSNPELPQPDRAYMANQGAKTMLLLPMEFQNRIIGLIQLIDTHLEHNFTYVEIALAQLLANQAANALENAKLYNMAQQQLAERIKAEAELRRVSARNQAILNALPDTLLILNHEGHLLDYKLPGDIPPLPLPLILPHLTQLRLTGHMQAFECQPTPTHHFEIRLVSSGQAEVLAILRDITARKQAQQAIQASEARLKAIFDNSLQTFILIDLETKIQAFNKTAAEGVRLITGQEITPGASLYDFAPEPEQAELKHSLTRAMRGEPVILEKKIRVAHHEKWFEYRYHPVLSHQGHVTGVCFSTVDIDQRKRAADTLAASEARLLAEMQSVLSITRALVTETQPNTLLQFIINQAKQLMKTDGALVLLLSEDGQTLTANPSTLQLPLHGSLAELALTTHTIQFSDPHLNHDYLIALRKHLAPTPLHALLCAPLAIQGDTLGVLLLWTQTERKFTDRDSYLVYLFADQAALALYNARLHLENRQLAIEQERQRLARELHDSVTQSLYSIGMAAQASLRLLNQGQENHLPDPLHYIHQLTQTALAEMRERVYDLHPTVLKDSSLVEILESYCDTLTEQYGLTIDFKADKNLTFSIYQRENLYYIAREALWNIVKHAGPTQVKLQLVKKANHIILTITDHGPGFTLPPTQHSQMLGLRTMEERAKLLMGTFQITSEPQTGTRVIVRIPAQQPQPEPPFSNQFL